MLSRTYKITNDINEKILPHELSIMLINPQRETTHNHLVQFCVLVVKEHNKIIECHPLMNSTRSGNLMARMAQDQISLFKSEHLPT
jgi:hypothetical protein